MLSAIAGSAALVFGTGQSQADVLIDIAPPSTNGSSISLTQANAIGFSLAADYFDVMIEASLVSTLAGNSGTAYLTTAIGAGTTAADVVASTNFDFAQVGNVSADVSFVGLFDGLSLGAGDYFLVFGAPLSGDGFISLSSNPYMLDPNASVGDMFFSPAADLDPNFIPASTFTVSGLGNRYFRVEGVIPAPASLGLLGFGALAMSRRRR
ncbi:MAG: PEP-CTERM sorting domain-containing protein [Phycisphaerales bacterium]